MIRIHSTLIVVLFVSAAEPVNAAGINSETLTFEGATGIVFNIGEFFDVGDYRFTFAGGIDDGGVGITAQDNVVEAGTTKILATNHAEIELTRVDNRPFSLHAFDLGGSFLVREDRWADHVDVISSAGTYTAALSEIDPVYTSHTPDIANVTSVLFRPFPRAGGGPNDLEYSLDNLHLSVVPEASTLTLWCVALLMAMGASRARLKSRLR